MRKPTKRKLEYYLWDDIENYIEKQLKFPIRQKDKGSEYDDYGSDEGPVSNDDLDFFHWWSSRNSFVFNNSLQKDVDFTKEFKILRNKKFKTDLTPVQRSFVVDVLEILSKKFPEKISIYYEW